MLSQYWTNSDSSLQRLVSIYRLALPGAEVVLPLLQLSISTIILMTIMMVVAMVAVVVVVLTTTMYQRG